MKHITVSAAIIHDSQNRIFATQRGSGSLTLLEHEAARWLAPHELDSVQWLPADWEVIEILKQRFQLTDET